MFAATDHSFGHAIGVSLTAAAAFLACAVIVAFALIVCGGEATAPRLPLELDAEGKSCRRGP